MTQKKVFICPTTHWDREWVMTFEQYQVRLINLMDNLINIMNSNKDYKFLLDGQSIPLEDYLEIRPEMQETISELLRNRQLIAGPWYVLADQFLENGESTIRNLMLGMDKVEQLGGTPMMNGYVPDSFGSIGALPTILKGFGIDFANFGRGRPYWSEKFDKFEFWWEGPDGSKILTANHGYGNGLFLSYSDIWTDIFNPSSYKLDAEKVLIDFMHNAKSQEKNTATDSLYFSVGVDHMEPKTSLVKIVKYINDHQNEYELIYGTTEDYLRAVRESAGELFYFKGEMRGSEECPMELVGTLSSYMQLKQANDNCEILLQRILEPLWVMVSKLEGSQYPAGHLKKLWKLLIATHPHDSICGCSIDQVHKDMMNRYEKIQNTGSYLIKDGLHKLLSKIDTTCKFEHAIALTVVNPSIQEYSGPVKGLVRVPKRFKHEQYKLTDEEGNMIPAVVRLITSKQKDLESVYMTNDMLAHLLSKDADDKKPDRDVFTVLDVAFLANSIPSAGYKTLYLMLGDEEYPMSSKLVHNENEMENEFLRIAFNEDSTLNITDKQTGHTYFGLNYLIDREDIGDSYNHKSCEAPHDIDSRRSSSNWSLYEANNHCITYATSLIMDIPEEAGRANNRSTNTKTVPVTIFASIYAGVGRLDMKVELDNVCKDHCLRVGFNTGIFAETVSACDHFNILERNVSKPNRIWMDNPFQEFVDVSDNIHGLCITTKGLPAYEAISSETGVQLYITLLRATGRLGYAAGADHPVPGAQCQGKFSFEYSIIPHSGSWYEGNCLENATSYRSPILLEADIQHEGTLPPAASFINIDCEDNIKPQFSCIKQSEDGKDIILRLWNPGMSLKTYVRSYLEIKNIQSCKLNEEILEGGEPVSCEVVLKSKAITTLRINI